MTVGAALPRRGLSEKKRRRREHSASTERLQHPTSNASAAAAPPQLLSCQYTPLHPSDRQVASRTRHKESLPSSSSTSVIPFFPPLSPLPSFPTEEQSRTGTAKPSPSDTLGSVAGAAHIPPLPQLLSIPALVRAREGEVRALLEGIRNIPNHLHAKQHQQREQNQLFRQQRQQEQLPRKQRHQLQAAPAGDAEEGTTVEGPGGTTRAEHQGVAKRAFQRLHVELRRRCMSYNPYRVPRRYRRPILEEMAKAPPRPSRRVRKDRRRPAALAAIYSQRAAFPRRWLTTHFFHAKRFHMVNLWGYRLASHPTQRCQRKLYRYSKHKALIHDRSYMQLFELRGSLEALSGVLVACGADASVFCSRPFLSGRQRGRLSLFTRGQAHERRTFIGPAEFLWKPVDHPVEAPQEQGKDNGGVSQSDPDMRRDAVRTLWLWIHPSASEAAHTELREAAKVQTQDEGASSEDSGARSHGGLGGEPGDSCTVASSNVDSGAVQIELLDDVAWLELTGPHSLALLALTLKTPSTRRCLQHHRRAREAAKGSALPVSGEACMEAHHTPLAAEATTGRENLAVATDLAVSSQLWWKRVVHETLTNGCCSAAPPGDAILPLDVFLPPLLGPFPPRSRRIPGVPAQRPQETLQGPRLDGLRHTWCESRWPASRLFDKAVRSETTAAASKCLWQPTRRSRKRVNLKKLLLRLKAKQAARQALRAKRGTPQPGTGSSEETQALGGGVQTTRCEKLSNRPLSETTQRGVAKRSYDSDWEDLAETTEVREEGKRRRHREEGGGTGLVLHEPPQPGRYGFQEVSMDPGGAPDQNILGHGDEDLGEVVTFPESPHEQPPALSLSGSAATVRPSDEASEKPVPPCLRTEENGISSPSSRRPLDAAPSLPLKATAQSELAGSAPSGGSRTSALRAIPCLVVWRAPPSAPFRSFVSTSPGCVQALQKSSASVCLPSRSIAEQMASGPPSPFSGIDLFLPVSSGVARLFVLLCRYGARPIGCRDRRKLLLESGAADFPFDFPDTQAGTHAALCAAWQDELSHHRRPPGKRVNFAANATPCPFFPMWQFALAPADSGNPGGSRASPPAAESSDGAAHRAGDVGAPANGVSLAAMHPAVPLQADARGGAPLAVPDWVRSAFSAYVKRELRTGAHLEASFLPPSLLPWLAPPACHKSRKRKSLPGFRADAPLMPSLPPVPPRLPVPDAFLPIPVLRLTHLDFLRFLASERRSRTRLLEGKQAIRPAESSAVQTRSETEPVPAAAPGPLRAPPGAVHAFLAEVSSLLRDAHAASPERCSVQRSSRRRRGGRREVEVRFSRSDRNSTPKGGRSAAAESTVKAPETAQLSCEMEARGSSAHQTQTGKEDSPGVTGATPGGSALRQNPPESAVRGWFVPVQVEAHLRGVPRRLCQLFLMTEEDILRFFENYHLATPSATNRSRAPASVSPVDVRAGLADHFAGPDSGAEPLAASCGAANRETEVLISSCSGRLKGAQSPLHAEPNPRRAGNGVAGQAPRRAASARREAFSLEEPVHRSFTRRQLAKKAVEVGPGQREAPKGGAGETAAPGIPADPNARSRLSNQPACEASSRFPHATFVPQRAVTRSKERDGCATDALRCATVCQLANVCDRREGPAMGFWTQTMAATLAPNSGRFKQGSRDYGKHRWESEQSERITTASPSRGADAGRLEELVPQRRLIGFVTTGQHSLARGKGVGIACVSADAFLEALQLQLRMLCAGRSAAGYPHESAHGSRVCVGEVDCRGVRLLVWMRNVQSRRYHPAWISLILQN
uniref:POPLD (NUC188) domain-containing protein n=1 Tax=Neospora caninum (strain Liverpool) TaxID=572307 RepID=A0A0F7U5I9_NEOCL|nr:TPA: POPLD (NUC188) domain-containing protein [Neospora caninum Liverpool]